MVMGSLLEVIVGPGKPWPGWETRFSAKPSLSPCMQGGAPVIRRTVKEEWITRLPALSRFMALLIGEAVSFFECGPSLENARSECSNACARPEQSRSKTDPPALRPHVSWATWVIQTFLGLELKHLEMGWPPTGRLEENQSSKTAEHPSIWNITSGDTDGGGNFSNSVFLAVSSARSPEAFATVLRAAIRGSLDEAGQTSALSLCSQMLHVSRLTTPIFTYSPEGYHETESVVETTTPLDCSYHNAGRSPVLQEDEFTSRAQERALARAFSARLRSEVSTHSFTSPLLQSQLELLAQWQLRRSAVSGEREFLAEQKYRVGEKVCGPEEINMGGDNTSSPSKMWSLPDRDRTNSWDVATTAFAGVGGGGDDFETVQAKPLRPVGLRRPGTAGSEASALSNIPTLPGRPTTPGKNSLLVETASASSITVSWGGWLDTNHGPVLRVGVGSDGVAYPVIFGTTVGTSDLAQALRSKLKHASGRRRAQGPSLVLKVRQRYGKNHLQNTLLRTNSKGETISSCKDSLALIPSVFLHSEY